MSEPGPAVENVAEYHCCCTIKIFVCGRGGDKGEWFPEKNTRGGVSR